MGTKITCLNAVKEDKKKPKIIFVVVVIDFLVVVSRSLPIVWPRVELPPTTI